MAGIEGIKGAGMAYQGSMSTAEMRAEAQPKIEAGEVEITSERLASETSKINTKGVSADGEGNSQGGMTPEQQQEAIKKAVEDINKRQSNSTAIFGIHEGTNRVTIKLVDRESRKVIKELPPEQTLDMIEKIWEMAGILVDEKR